MKRLAVITAIPILITGLLNPLLSQEPDKKEFSRSYQEADVLFYYDKDYTKAAVIYDQLHNSFPANCNLAAKLGICYLNLDGKKKEALSLLKKAVKNTVVRTKDYVEQGEKAPFDTYLYLGLAYHINDSLEQALFVFRKARELYSGTDNSKISYIENQIRDCSYAIEMKKKPLTIISNLFIPWLNNFPGAINPVLAKNDSVFIFTQKTEGKTRILCSYRENQWSKPVDITSQLGGYTRFYSNSVTGDGKLLILFMDDGGDGNLYYSERSDTTWTRVKPLGRNINSIYWESHGFITPDGSTIYFSSNRPGGKGELDIWISERNKDGSWDQPSNCGEIINTPYNEDTPFFDPVNSALIFSSDGHISMGGYDVLRSVNRNGRWSNPVGMPFAFNTTLPNNFFILNNNAPGFVTSLYDDNTGSRNIYSLVAVDPADEITVAEGALHLLDGSTLDANKAVLTLNEEGNGDQMNRIQLRGTGEFRFEIKPGNYQLISSYPGYQSDTVIINLPQYFLSHYMAINPTLIPETVVAGIFLTLKTVLFEFNSYDLDETAKTSLDEIKSILIRYPDLKIEVAGYTDAKGSTEFNYMLADKRAQAVIDYMVSSSYPSVRFIKKSFGESLFTSENTNPDGSDNPEGRKYNRRVTFGVVDPQTGIVLRQETFTPEHLRLPSSMKYSVILKESTEKLPSGNFDVLNLSGRLFLRTIESGSVYLYAIGVFYNESDAIDYLGYVRGKGFTDASIINQYELDDKVRQSAKSGSSLIIATGKRVYTIQLAASKSPLDQQMFRDVKGIKEILGDDGYYRYVTGEFSSESQAEEALKPLVESGYKNATIRELNQLVPK